ncbi:hypothetical protein HPT25_27895 [Bacillus sp. BRMEA1]|uniref:hypothetical protein n=1 Tax=Neobacillus endophyticus TaxID=2738405 RepID=UPI001564A739|nr:hypothetical protein [Neobacillus endophyticus]NRD81118.1 hypothetical protein [Neobacillus endophyticus]
MPKKEKPTFIIELKCKTETWQQHILDTRFELARKLYNATLSNALKQIKKMKESTHFKRNLHLYRETKSLLKKTNHKSKQHLLNKQAKNYRNILDSIRLSFGLSEYGLHAYVAKPRQAVADHIDSLTAQKVASSVWRAVQKVLFEGKKAHFKKFGTLTSVEGKTNTSGIRFKSNTVHWNGLVLPVKSRKNDLFVHESLALHRIKYCRLVKKIIRGKSVYYVQLIMDGIPPAKRIHSTGAFRYKVSPDQRVGIDIGTSTVAVVSETEVILQPLASKVDALDKEKQRLLRKMDRSRRATNPHRFLSDGTVKKGKKEQWVRSQSFLKTLFQLKEVYRKRQAVLKEQHGRLANHVLSLGNEVYLEKMHFQGLAKRAKETKINEKTGKYQRKKRFGKSIGSYAPSLFVKILKQKLTYQGKELHEVNTITFKASQYNLMDNTYQKKKLHQRWSQIGEHPVQRDLYSAFLLMNSDDTLKQTDKCKRSLFFCKKHHHFFKFLRNNIYTSPK